MLLDVILLSILAIFALLGLWRGAIASGTSLVSLVLAYLGAIWAAKHLGVMLAGELGVTELVGIPMAGTIGFFLTWIVVGAIGSLLRRWDRGRRDDAPRGWIDRSLGAGFGLVRGGLVVLLLSWLAIWIDAGRDLGAIQTTATLPETEDSRFARVTQNALEGAIESALGDAERDGEGPNGARVVARLAARPGSALKGVQEILDDPRLEELQQDQLFWTLIENGASERALNRLSFYRISHDDAMRQNLAELGLISDEAARDVDVFREEAGAVLDHVGPRLKGLREDPEIQRLAHDPEIVEMLQSGNTLALLGRPEIQQLVDRISSRGATPIP